jgi:phosphohistidine phosphatase SixA
MRWLCVATLYLAVTVSALAADNPAWPLLRDGARVVLLRHAQAPGGAGDPAGFRLDDCATQRSLSGKGRADAKALGERIRAQNIPVGKVLSSQWCRCKDTATLLDAGPVEASATFNNAFVLRERRDELTKGARDVIAAWKGPGVLVVVTHGANILPLTGIQPAEGEMIVVEGDPLPDGKLRVIGRIAQEP